MSFQPGRHYTRKEIHDAVGGGTEEYLPTKDGRVVGGCFKHEANTNPDAPTVVLPGFGEKIERTAEIFAKQTKGVPIFLKRASNQWQYVGDWRVKRLSKDPAEIARHEKRANRQGDISMVLFLERAN
jgi:hypothetical protein